MHGFTRSPRPLPSPATTRKKKTAREEVRCSSSWETVIVRACTFFFFFFCQKPPCKILSLRHFSVEVLEHLSMKISAGGGGRQAGRAADEQGKTANRFSPHRTPLLRFLPCLLAPRISAESMKSVHNEAPAGTTMVRPRLLRRVYVFRVTLGGFFWLGGWRRKTGPVIKTPLSDDVLSQTERRTEREGIRGREEQTGGSSN